MNIVILAAGAGQRMLSSLPKVLHPLAGRPLLSHVLETARTLMPSRLIVVIGNHAAAVRQAVAAPDIEFVIQKQPLGTGHAVQQALPLLDSAQPTLVLYGDVPLIRASTLKQLIDITGPKRCGLLTATLADPAGYGRIVRDNAAQVTRIVEHKDANQAEQAIHEVNTGIIIIPAGSAADWLASLKNDNAQREYYLTNIIEYAIADHIPLMTMQPQNEWEILGVNNKAQLAVVERRYQQNLAYALLEAGVMLADPARVDIRGTLKCGKEVSIDINCIFEGQVTLGDGVQIGAHCVLKNATIGTRTTLHAFTHIENTQIGVCASIGPYARLRPGTVLADETRIGNFVEIKNTAFGVGSRANHLAYLGDAEIGAHVNIGAGVITCNYDGANKHRTVIEDDVFVGSDSQLVAPIRVARGATIAAGTTLWKDVRANTLVLNEKTQSIKEKEGYLRPVKKKG